MLPAGDATHPGKVVHRGFLQLISGTQDGFKVFGSGRREIAELIAAGHPYETRVLATTQPGWTTLQLLQAVAAVFGDIVVERLRAFDFTNNGRARFTA